jgi:hypothetical protein
MLNHLTFGLKVFKNICQKWQNNMNRLAHPAAPPPQPKKKQYYDFLSYYIHYNVSVSGTLPMNSFYL